MSRGCGYTVGGRGGSTGPFCLESGVSIVATEYWSAVLKYILRTLIELVLIFSRATYSGQKCVVHLENLLCFHYRPLFDVEIIWQFHHSYPPPPPPIQCCFMGDPLSAPIQHGMGLKGGGEW